MKRIALVPLILLACSTDEAKEPLPAEAPPPVVDEPAQPVGEKVEAGEKTELDVSYPPYSPYTLQQAEEHGWMVTGKTIGGTEIFSQKGKPPPLEISDEAKGYLERYGGWLTWSPDAPGGGQWGWEPRERGCGHYMQWDQVADISIILAGVELEAHCRLCADRVRGQWRWRGCSCEALQELEDLYVTTENRLARDGNTDRFTGMGFYGYDSVEECEKRHEEMRKEMEAYERE